MELLVLIYFEVLGSNSKKSLRWDTLTIPLSMFLAASAQPEKSCLGPGGVQRISSFYCQKNDSNEQPHTPMKLMRGGISGASQEVLFSGPLYAYRSPYIRAPVLSVKEWNVCNTEREFTANATTTYSKMFWLKRQFPLLLQAGLK
jgi:hypothetical protein